jgi:acyl-homoserine-lactone acylase
MGYAFAWDNMCTLMDDIVTIRGERSRYFGRNGPTHINRANGSNPTNINADFFWKHVANDARVESLLAAQPSNVRDALQGYADGFSRYVRELKAGQHPGAHPDCAGAEWLGDIDLNDMGRRVIRLSVLASSSVFMNEIGSMQPPSPETVAGLLSGLPDLIGGSLPISAPALDTEELLEQAKSSGRFDEFPFGGELNIGSNMYALGKDATQDGNSYQFVNPHFPWYGTERLHMSHLMLENDEEDWEIMGASLHGAPAVLIGFNEHLAWSHTVSTAYRFTIYELTLVPGAPTSYLYDGGIREMEATEYSIQVMEDNGEITEQKRTLYRSHYGPIMNLHIAEGLGPFEWTPVNAYAIRDANLENDRLMEHFMRWNMAESLEEFEAIQDELVAVPWVNTTATAPGKHAYYSDVTTVPNVPDEMTQPGPTGCSNSILAPVVAQLAPGLPVLDGNRSACEWRNDPDSPQDGIFGASNLPKLRRDDWVHNCNDSYWLTNPEEPVEGYAAIIGDENAERSLRTRKCIRQVQQRLDGTDGRDGTKFNRENLKEIVLSSEIYSEELARESLIATFCDANPSGQVLSQAGPVDVTQACDVLKAWDGTTNLESVGGHIWREFWKAASGGPIPVVGSPVPIWLTPFSNDDPVNTPNTLNIANPLIMAAFGDAVNKLVDAGVALDAKLGDIQWAERNGDRIPIFGDIGGVGAFTIAVSSLNNDGTGYGPVDYGNSYVQVIGWDEQGNPEADAFITYSQATDSASPHYRDWTERYSRKEWKRLPFTQAQIEAEKIREMDLRQ